MPRVKLSSKNQIVIPGSVREQFGLHAGDELEVSVIDGKAIIDKAAPNFQRFIHKINSSRRRFSCCACTS